jgi:long-subunit fatty acid transport protein
MKKNIVAVLLVFTVVQAQNFNLTGAGARAEGFGGAFIGLADDATAVVWNPAGLTQLERAEASIVTRYVSEGAKYKFSFDPSLDEEESLGHFGLNFASGALPLTLGGMKIVLAAAFQRQLDFFYSKTEKSNVMIGGSPYKYKNRNEDRGGVNTITPAIGVKLSPMFSVGFSANIWTGNLDSKSREEVETFGRNLNIFNLDYSGLNFVFGGMADFEGSNNGFPLKIGLTLRTPFRLDATGDYDLDEEIPDILPAAGTASFSIRQQIQMPLMFGVGASYRIGDNFTVALDYEMRSYGNKKIKIEATSKSTGNVGNAEEDISESKSDFNEIRIGAEYLLVLDNGVIPLRLGYKTVPTRFANYRYDVSASDYVISDQVSGSAISFGSGYITDAFAFDVTFSTASFMQKYDSDAQIDFSTGTLSTSVIIYF